MTRLSKLVLASVVTLGVAGAIAAPLIVEAADSHRMENRAEHTDGRVAYLKAELKITPAQEADWSRVEKAMRDNAAERAKLRDQFAADRDKPLSAVDRLARRQAFAQARANSITTFATAFKSLYDQMSDDQRKAADALFQPHAHRG